jgi:cytochrome P450
LIRTGNSGAARLTDYFRRLVAIRRSDPQEDLLSGLIAAEEHGDRLSEDELLATSVMLFLAGHETTVNLIGNGMLALLQHPDQLERLRQEPSLTRGAVEELLRYDSPVQRTGIRFAAEDVEVEGGVIRRGDMVTGFIGAANRDPDQFANPDDLDLARLNTRHLSFAAGSHYCLGAALARLEAQVAFATLLQRFPDLHLLVDEPAWRQTAQLRGLQSLHVGF